MRWLPPREKPIQRAAYIALLISAFVGAVHVFAAWFSVAPHGSDWMLKYVTWKVLGAYFIGGLFGVLYLIVVSIGRLLRIGKTTWPQLGAIATFCGVLFVVLLLAMGLGETIRNSVFKATAGRAAPLVTAIQQYQAKHGAPPPDLAALVPEFISAVPGTGMGAYPNYQYLPKPAPAEYNGNPWVLFVDVSPDNQTRDRLIFYPNQNYPSRPAPPVDVRRLGDWALVSAARPSNSK